MIMHKILWKNGIMSNSNYDVLYFSLDEDKIEVHTDNNELYKLEHDDVTYYKDAAIKFLKDRNCTFEGLIEES